MVDTPKTEAPKTEEKKATKYFKNCTHPGGAISLGFKLVADPTTEQLVKFTKYVYRVHGFDVVEGYLATDNIEAINSLEADRYAVTIDKAEYDKALKDGRQIV